MSRESRAVSRERGEGARALERRSREGFHHSRLSALGSPLPYLSFTSSNSASTTLSSAEPAPPLAASPGCAWACSPWYICSASLWVGGGSGVGLGSRVSLWPFRAGSA